MSVPGKDQVVKIGCEVKTELPHHLGWEGARMALSRVSTR
jgi:hypothetical protein